METTGAGAASDRPSSVAIDDAAEPTSSGRRPEMYVVAHNVAKRHNLGMMMRSCTAFDVKALVLIGSRKFNAFGSQGADAHVAFEHYETLREAREGLTAKRGVTRVLGVEIVESAEPIESHPFTGNTAFVMGNEGHGLTEQQKAICDGFVYIRQYGPGTASLNVSVAASIVMHQFALWANYQERERVGEKFVVAERPLRTRKRGEIGEDPEEVRARRAAARAARELENARKDEDSTPLIEALDM